MGYGPVIADITEPLPWVPGDADYPTMVLLEPVFFDDSVGRRRLIVRGRYVTAVVCLAYMTMLGVSITALPVSRPAAAARPAAPVATPITTTPTARPAPPAARTAPQVQPAPLLLRLAVPPTPRQPRGNARPPAAHPPAVGTTPVASGKPTTTKPTTSKTATSKSATTKTKTKSH